MNVLISSPQNSERSSENDSFRGFSGGFNGGIIQRQHMNVRNIDINRYYQSDIGSVCHLCDKKYVKRIVNHYKKEHPESEVYASRLSKDMVAAIELDPRMPVYEDKTNCPQTIVHAHCYLCNDIKRFQTYYWQQHYSTHTGEYMYYCHMCEKMVGSAKHCDYATERITPINHLRSTDLNGFVCSACNYIQLNEENMKIHQTNEHEYYGQSPNYRKVCLVASRQTVVRIQSGI